MRHVRSFARPRRRSANPLGEVSRAGWMTPGGTFVLAMGIVELAGAAQSRNRPGRAGWGAVDYWYAGEDGGPGWPCLAWPSRHRTGPQARRLRTRRRACLSRRLARQPV
jgi:hypothetical protein